MSDILRLVRAMDAIQRVLAACVEIQRARTHWIARTAFDIVRKRAEPPLLTLGRRPSRPFFLAADCGHAGPGLSILAHDRAVANSPCLRAARSKRNVQRSQAPPSGGWNDLTFGSCC